MGIGYRHFGFLSFGEGDGLRFTWLQVVWQKGIALELNDRGPDRDGGSRWSLTLGLGLVWIYLNLPFLTIDRKLSQYGSDGFGDSWGFSYHIGRDWGSALHWHWGGHVKIIDMPWALTWVRTSYLLDPSKQQHVSLVQRRIEGVPPWLQWWYDETDSRTHTLSGVSQFRYVRDLVKPSQWREVYPYTYTLKNGTVQLRDATVTVEEREWRRRGWKWSRLGRKVRRSIAVEFSDEVGERSGSWKGGTIGCGYDLRPGETPLECLRRMERERKL